jgi:hypothetical protein
MAYSNLPPARLGPVQITSIINYARMDKGKAPRLRSEPLPTSINVRGTGGVKTTPTRRLGKSRR